MAIPVAKPKALLADKGYDGDAVRENLLMHGILPIIPPKANRREPIHCDFRRYRDRNRIERMFGQLKQFRRIATRYDKTALSFASFLNLAAIRRWLPHFVNAAYIKRGHPIIRSFSVTNVAVPQVPPRSTWFHQASPRRRPVPMCSG